ncbi:hypothetical protein D3C76_546330 [compost metagenome]
MGDADLRQQPRFDFLGFNTEAAQLDLLIETSEVFDHAIGGPARTVTGAVQTRALLAQWIDHKTLGGQARTAQVTPGQADTADAQFPRHTGRHRVEVAVEYAADDVAQRSTDRRALAIGGGAVPMGHVDRGFGRAVAVVQLHGRQSLQHPIAQVGGQRFATGEQPTQAGAFGAERFVDEQRQQRRHEVQRGHAVRLNQLRNAMGIAVLTRPGKQQPGPGDQRPEALPHRHVETDRRFLHQHIGFIETVSVLHPLQAFGEGRMGVANAFRLAGRTRGVDHIGQVVAVQVQARRMARPTLQVQGIQGDDADAFAGRQAIE